MQGLCVLVGDNISSWKVRSVLMKDYLMLIASTGTCDRNEYT